VVFSSATLSSGKEFGYFARTLGVDDYSSSSIESSFNFEQQVLIYLPKHLPVEDEIRFIPALQQLVQLLRLSGGRALVLVNSMSEVRKIRRGLKEFSLPFEFLWEDRGERGYLAQRFREEVSSVLVGTGFWEGIDVPGPALSLLVIWQLPFPKPDPLIEARCQEVKKKGLDPLISVDYPEMGLKLKQGCGRLIRTKDDRGAIAIMEPVRGVPWEPFVTAALPQGAGVTENIDALVQIFQ
jgi:ATP-dependent DNA helicase DinG